MNTVDLQALGLEEMNEGQMMDVDGGIWWLPAALAIGLVLSAINNFGDIREGVVDGWNGTPRH